MSDRKNIKIVLAGNPNCGKSSLFNSLTGLKQKITNVPGTTIENKVGKFTLGNNDIELIDTPGTYSFNPKSLDEKESSCNCSRIFINLYDHFKFKFLNI